jgi:hypothetical protein
LYVDPEYKSLLNRIGPGGPEVRLLPKVKLLCARTLSRYENSDKNALSINKEIVAQKVSRY